MFVLGIAIFALSSAGCAAAQSMLELIAARCIQGIGGALLVPESLALITASFDERQRGAAIGTWSGFLAATMAIGPLLGGWLVQAYSWRLIFVINIPIAIVVIALTLRCVDESRDDDRPCEVDWIGALLATIALGLLTYGFIDLQGTHVTAAGIAAVLCGAGLLIAFVFVERHSAAPMIPLGIFASRDFTVANLYTLGLYAALGAAFFFIPFNLINVQHYTPLAAGAALLPMIVLMFVSSRWAGALVSRIGARIPLTVGAAIAGAGFFICSLAGIGGPYWTTFLPGIVALGIGTSTFVAPLTTTVMNAAPAAHAGSASGINNAVSRVAGLLAIAVLGIVVVNSTQHALHSTGSSLPPSVRQMLARDSLISGRAPSNIPHVDQAQAQHAVERAYVVGFRNALQLCALLAWVSAIMAGTLLTRAPRQFASASLTRATVSS
jgi:EmrB/QacA subfamily drug resistance transporter